MHDGDKFLKTPGDKNVILIQQPCLIKQIKYQFLFCPYPTPHQPISVEKRSDVMDTIHHLNCPADGQIEDAQNTIIEFKMD